MVLIPAIILWLSVNLYYFWIKLAGAIFLITGLLELVCFLFVVVAALVLIVKVLRQKEWRNSKNYWAVGLAVAVIASLNIGQLRADENTLQSAVKIRACYEGTMNTSRLYLRENGTFEDFNIGWFGHVRYLSGTWKLEKDTLLLDFNGEAPAFLKGKLLIRDSYLYRFKGDSLESTLYYLGNCKGLN